MSERTLGRYDDRTDYLNSFGIVGFRFDYCEYNGRSSSYFVGFGDHCGDSKTRPGT